LIVGESNNKVKQLGQFVLPIKTPQERYEEVTKKLDEKQRKSEERKAKKAASAAGTLVTLKQKQ